MPYHTTRPTFITLAKNAIDITGQRFGRLVALGPIRRQGRAIIWLCQCDCGKGHEVMLANLRAGGTLSCGCWRRDRISAENTIHNMRNEPVYKVWTGVKDRCTNSKGSHYSGYGARGITICDEWRDSFEAFYGCVSKLPNFGEPAYSLDRIDNDGNYEPGNVRWATPVSQARNRHTNRVFEFDGVSRTLAGWAEVVGIPRDTLRKRLEMGWSVRDALLTKLHDKP